MFSSQSDVIDQLKELDTGLPDGLFAELVVLGGAAMFFYNIEYRTTMDIDVAFFSGQRAARLIMEKGEQLGISAQAHGVAFLGDGWENRVEWAADSFTHLRVGVLDPYDWVLSKLARWRGHDEDDVRAVLPRLDSKELFSRLRDSLPDYIGRERDLQVTWNILAEDMGYKEKFAL
ncbi:hypothetical protein CEB3_c19730 [Peptococcaceae bacterium CEB3]|nr:hypothetical protein CEB3_c19730 [Peptococcaceae bacterium CEB3]